MALTSNRIQYNETLSYELFDDGYDIYNKDVEGTWISQRAPYNRVYKADGTDEENCLLQLKSLTEVVEDASDVEEN